MEQETGVKRKSLQSVLSILTAMTNYSRKKLNCGKCWQKFRQPAPRSRGKHLKLSKAKEIAVFIIICLRSILKPITLTMSASKKYVMSFSLSTAAM